MCSMQGIAADVCQRLSCHLQPADVVDLDQAQALAPGLKAQVQAVLREIDDYVLVE